MRTANRDVRERILAAAGEEFAQHGVAGARTDRIARRAKTSKERVYTYFRGKQDLYRSVAERELASIKESTHLDATDLPGYAGRIHDYFTDRPEHLRLMHWGLLGDIGADNRDDPFREAVRRTIEESAEEVRRAQDDGYLDPAWDPVDVVVIVNQIATSWTSHLALADLASGVVRDPSRAARRAAIVAAVAGLFPALANGAASESRPAVAARS
ncbi:TetR family transcriptional regulator [Rhodococcus koreensis]